MAVSHLGADAKAYYGTAGSTANTLMSNIKDVTLNLEAGEADTTTRAGGGWRSTRPTLLEGTAEFAMQYDPTEGAFSDIKDAFLDKTSIALRFLHAASGEGIDADFSIMSFSRPEPLEDVIVVNVTAKINTDDRTPTWEE